jgi:hypothetical protein
VHGRVVMGKVRERMGASGGTKGGKDGAKGGS